MDRVTTNADDIAGRVLDLLRGAYLTGAEAQRIRCAVGIAECRAAARGREADRAAMEAYRERVRRHIAKGAELLGVVWSDSLEEEAVLQGQDGPDPEYHVAPRFGGVEMRAMPADRPEGMPDALAPLYAVQGEQAAMSEQYRCPLTGDAPDDDDDGGDDPDSTPVVPFDGDAQEGE